MFSQACVKNSIYKGGWGVYPGACLLRGVSAWGVCPGGLAGEVGGVCPGVCLPKGMLGYTHTSLGRHPSEHYGIRSTSVRYASYWNAFFLVGYFQKLASEI